MGDEGLHGKRLILVYAIIVAMTIVAAGVVMVTKSIIAESNMEPYEDYDIQGIDIQEGKI